MSHYIPISIYTLIALIVFLRTRRQSGGLQAVAAATCCGVIVLSFTGGAAGAVWLAQFFLFLMILVMLRPPASPAYGSGAVTRVTYLLFFVFVVGIGVAFLRYDPSVELIKAGSYTTVLGIPVRVLMTGYRFLVVASLFLCFAIPLRYRVDRRVLGQCVTLCWIFALALAVMSFIDYFGIADLAFSYRREAGYGRVGILGFNRASHGKMLFIGLFLSFAVAELTHSHLRKLAAYVSIPLLVIAMLYSWSRSSLVALIVGSLCLILVLFGTRALLKGVALLGAIGVTATVALFKSPDLQARFSFLWTGGLGDSAGRLAGWSDLLSWLAHRPDVLASGAGFQNFHYMVNLSEAAVSLEAAHNSYLHFLAEFGVLGLCVFLAWLVCIFAWLILWRRSAPDRCGRVLPGVFMSMMAGLAASCIASESLAPSHAMVPLQFHIYLLLGTWVSFYRTETEAYFLGQADGGDQLVYGS